MNEFKVLSYELRQNVVDMIMSGKGGHIGGDMSMMDILTTLYFKVMNISPENMDDPNRDRFILSKGHSVETLYAVLAKKGFFPIEQVIAEFSHFGSKFIGHPNNKLPGIEMNSGSLGHGLPVAVGMALAGKMDDASYRTYVVMGDGELAEGSVWEGAMAASHYKLDNLCAVVDRNRFQISGSTEDVMHHDDLEARFSAFGWHVIQVDGHDYDALAAAFDDFTLCSEFFIALRRVNFAPAIALVDKYNIENARGVLQAGADLCLDPRWPVDLVVDHIMAQFRRYTSYSQSENQWDGGTSFLQRGDIYLDPQRHIVRVKERSVRLRRREFQLLKYFMEHPKVILSAEQICEYAWSNGGSYINGVSGPVALLRKAIEPDPVHPIYIKTARTLGYYFTSYNSETCDICSDSVGIL